LQSLVWDHLMFILISIFVCSILWYMGIIASGHIIFHITWQIVDLCMTLRVEHTRSIITKNSKNIKVDSDIIYITNKYIPLIKQYKLDIDDIVKANDYLSEYIDSL
jgi:hypothetical protein